MWPFSTIRLLQMEKVALSATLRERDRQLEKLEHEHSILRSDFNQLVATMGNLATRPVGGFSMGDADPFKEDNSKPDVYVSPEEGGMVDFDRLMTEATTPDGDERQGD